MDTGMGKNRRVYFTLATALLLLLLLGSGCVPGSGTAPERVDDWNASTGPQAERNGSRLPRASAPSSAPAPAFAPSAPGPGNIGLSAGGAKDINSFRENIKNGYLPLPTDVTYEGLFCDYYFDTGQTEESGKLFYPSYSYAVTGIRSPGRWSITFQ